ncbi:MAG: tRNA 2-thiouridine(34) synthase MnmA [Chloroflexi bacterium]|nr:tRNA 2-thiouridine(34) synthase MnmA [Chloroflexota bacterium]
MNNKRVVVAMSGGVDSSVAALLLKQQGYDVVGVTMRLWSVEDESAAPLNKRCCSVEDVQDARRVCDAIGARHYFMNFEREFQQHVIDYFVREYDRGRTPHPCLACNDKIKFDFLLRRALFMDADYIATGHYSRIRHDDERTRLLKGIDTGKDQSYVLFTLRQAELQRLLLPVGEYLKSEIRRIAADAGLPVADKPDSQEICFIPDGDYRKFVGERVAPKPGDMVDADGNVLGSHPGIQFFTIGQRRKLGLQGNTGEPMYVTSIDANANRVVLGRHEDLMRRELWASRINYIAGEPPYAPVEVTAKIRYKASEAPATLTPRGDWVELSFHEPQRAVTPGQAVTFYQGDEIIGGGIIETEAPAPVEVLAGR